MTATMITATESTITVRGPATVGGSVDCPGDKSLSHRALICAGLARGRSGITNLAPGDDVAATVDALALLGSPLAEASDVLDFRNSGTGLRTFLGVCAGLPVATVLTGDPSLRSRPMRVVVDPLRAMGAAIDGRAAGENAPLFVRGGALKGIRHETPFARTHIKSALLFAGLAADGVTEVIQPRRTRDHTERMLRALGADIDIAGPSTSVRGPATLAELGDYRVPGDISSAAFLFVAAAIIPGSAITVRAVGVNPTRTGILDVLADMGASVATFNQHTVLDEPVADVTVTGPDRLRATIVTGDMVARLVDELPALAIAMARAEGTSEVLGAEELRVKESDRVATIVSGLNGLGAGAEPRRDGFSIRGPQRFSSGTIRSHGDHRIAMAFAVAGLVAEGTVTVEDTACVATSWPEFASALAELAS